MKTSAYINSGAEFSPNGKYRYVLWRQLSEGEGRRTVLFVGLNPSTADATKDDPTIRRCVGFARDWGFDVLLMANLHAYRSTKPKGLWQVSDPVGPENAATLRALSRRATLIVVAWGGFPLHERAAASADWLLSLTKTQCLGLTLGGAPKHPLYLAKSTTLRSPRARS